MVNLGATAVGDQIHVLLHFAHYVYSPETTRWSKALPMFLPRHGFGIAALSNNLYTIGGCHIDLFDTRDTEVFSVTMSPNRSADVRAVAIAMGTLMLIGIMFVLAYVARRIRANP